MSSRALNFAPDPRLNSQLCQGGTPKPERLWILCEACREFKSAQLHLDRSHSRARSNLCGPSPVHGLVLKGCSEFNGS